jgi:hypothetical protein
MKTYRIRITCPGCAPVEYEGIFANAIDAINDAIDKASSPLCGIYTQVVKP